MNWYRHLPFNQGTKGLTGYPWFTRWDIPIRLEAARALVEHFDDERVAYWSVNEPWLLDAIARKERAAIPARQGRRL